MGINIYLAIALLIFSFLILPLVMLVVFYKNNKALKIVAIILFVLYLLFVSVLVFGRVRIKNDVVTVTLNKTSDWFSLIFCVASFGKREMFYNLVMMFPVSAFMLAITKKQKFNYKKTFFLTLLVSLIISICIETLQFVLPVARTTELFDLFTNTTSGAFGFCYFALFSFLFESALQLPQNSKHQ